MNQILEHVKENMQALNIEPSAIERLVGLEAETLNRILEGVEPLPRRLLKILDTVFMAVKADALFLKTRT